MNLQIIATAASLMLSAPAHAAPFESFFQIDLALGGAYTRDMGDGVWKQEGAPDNKEQIKSPAVYVGVSVPVYARGDWDWRANLGYTYIGEFSASVNGVPDEDYNPYTHKVSPTYTGPLSPFSGHGHVQGVSLTLETGYTVNGWRFDVEAGPWVYWQTWHESLYGLDNQWHDLSHKTVPQVGWVAGVGVSKGNFGVVARYYNVNQKWNSYPGLSRGEIAVMARYRF